MKLQPYHDTLQKAIDEGILYLIKGYDAVFDSDNLREPFTFDGVKYGESKESHSPIVSLKGKNTKKYAHLTIYRTTSGRYEVNVYVL